MTDVNSEDGSGLLSTLIDDGRPLLSLTGVMLILSGLFAFFLGVTKHFLPHDVAFLGMTPQELCAINECRIVHFMIHDRVSFGGALVAVGTLYLWLAAFPLKRGEVWAWWLFALSGMIGFASFLLYLGYGYLDTWHGVATLGLLPMYLIGMWQSFRHLNRPRSPHLLLRGGESLDWKTTFGRGRLLLLVTAASIAAGGF